MIKVHKNQHTIFFEKVQKKEKDVVIWRQITIKIHQKITERKIKRCFCNIGKRLTTNQSVENQAVAFSYTVASYRLDLKVFIVQLHRDKSHYRMNIINHVKNLNKK